MRRIIVPIRLASWGIMYEFRTKGQLKRHVKGRNTHITQSRVYLKGAKYGIKYIDALL